MFKQKQKQKQKQKIFYKEYDIIKLIQQECGPRVGKS